MFGDRDLIPQIYQYSRDHLWILVQNDGTVRIGVVDTPIQQLGKIQSVELPSEGEVIAKNVVIGSIAGELGSFDLVAPLSGVVTQVNSRLFSDPSSLEYMAFQEFLFDLQPTSYDDEAKELLSADEYQKHSL